MCVESSSKSGCGKGSCGCGGHGRAAAPPDPRAILAMKFDAPAAAGSCGCHACPRHYLAFTGFCLAGFLVLHLAMNALALWPAKFQAAVSRNHSLGLLLPVLEAGLIFAPLAVHVAYGLRMLRRDKLKYGVEKHHHGSDLRNWLQRLTALILLAFILFHLAVLHRWLGGRFDPDNAFASASHAIWQFWSGLPAGHPGNLLFAEFYLLGLAAGVYHVANGLVTGAEVLGWVRTSAAQDRLWRISACAAPALFLAGLAAWYALALR